MSRPVAGRPRLRWRQRERRLLRCALVGWAALTAPLLAWGLPSRSDDPLLFGDGPAWSSARLLVGAELERLRTRVAGADTDLNPIAGRDRLVELTSDDASRAEILRRYRLYSRQPDEMIIFRALQRMAPQRLDFDPHLYQYGGGYIYLVGAALGVAHVLGLASLSGDAAHYLDHPEAFARFYIVARSLSLGFGALTLLAVYRLGRWAGGGPRAGWIALLLAACTPVFITAALEAKPHLPAACVTLWAILSALDFWRRGRSRDATRLGVQTGYASGLVLTGFVAWLLPPLVWILGPHRRERMNRLLPAVCLAALVYVVTNPYVVYNAAFGRGALSHNLQNSLAMYAHQVERFHMGALRVVELLCESTGWLIPALGVAGLLRLLARHPRAALLAAAPGLATLTLAAMLGAEKPAEFARFLILPCLLLTVAAAWLIARWAARNRLALALTLPAALFAGPGPYVGASLAELRGSDSRRAAAAHLRCVVGLDETIGVLQEPAPYSVPPLDFARRRVVLLPPARPADFDPKTLPTWLVYTADNERVHARAWWRAWYPDRRQFPPRASAAAGWLPHLFRGGGGSPITWANKPVFVLQLASPGGQ